MIETSLSRDIRKGSIAIVVVERVLVDARNKQIWMPIVIVVADSNADVVAGPCQTRLVGHVCKNAVAVVAK